jgi:hypothetical protein
MTYRTNWIWQRLHFLRLRNTFMYDNFTDIMIWYTCNRWTKNSDFSPNGRARNYSKLVDLPPKASDLLRPIEAHLPHCIALRAIVVFEFTIIWTLSFITATETIIYFHKRDLKKLLWRGLTVFRVIFLWHSIPSKFYCEFAFLSPHRIWTSLMVLNMIRSLDFLVWRQWIIRVCVYFLVFSPIISNPLGSLRSGFTLLPNSEIRCWSPLH